jgi:hypothetical protein
MRQAQRSSLANTSHLVELAREKFAPPLVPDFVELKASAAKFWPLYGSARMAEEWRDYDLMMLANICNLEADIRDHEKVLASVGPVVEGAKGSPVANPLVGIIDTLRKQQLTYLRALSMVRITHDSSTDEKHKSKARQLQRAMSVGDGLLAGAR